MSDKMPAVPPQWDEVDIKIVDGAPTGVRIWRYFIDESPRSKLLFGAALVWFLVVPWKAGLIIVGVAGSLGFAWRRLQVYRARRHLPPGRVVTFRASYQEIQALPLTKHPLLPVERECVVAPTATDFEISLVADGLRPLLGTLPRSSWTMSLEVDSRGRAQTIHLQNNVETVVNKTALGRVPKTLL